MKKIPIILGIAGVLLLGGGAFVAGRLVQPRVQADDNDGYFVLDELKVGRYYRDGGTPDEFLEIYDDKTIQLFGYDYYAEVCKLNADLLEQKRAEGDEEFLAEFDAIEKEYADFWFARHYYVLGSKLRTIEFSETPPVEGQTAGDSSWVLFYDDENTIKFDDTHIYKFAE